MVCAREGNVSRCTVAGVEMSHVSPYSRVWKPFALWKCTALRKELCFLCTFHRQSSAHLQEMFDFASVQFCTSPVFKECSRTIMAKTDSPSGDGEKKVLHHYLLMRPPDPWTSPAYHSHPHSRALSAPLGHTHITSMCPNEPPDFNEEDSHLQFPGNNL